MKKPVYFICGLIALALGVAGVILPLLPTTPLILLAGFCFANSSPCFHRWLHQHPYFGQMIRQWQTHRAIPAKAKYLALGMMSLSLALLYYRFWGTDGDIFLVFATLLCLVGIVWIWRLPTS